MNFNPHRSTLTSLLKKAEGEFVSGVPQINVKSQPASPQNTLPGMVSPQNYTQVQSGSPNAADAGATAQKSQPALGAMMLPKQASAEEPTMSMTGRPLVQDLVKQAMSRSAHRAKIAAEGTHQLRLSAESKEDKEKDSCGDSKMAEAEIPTEQVNKLASAIEFLTPMLMKSAEVKLPAASGGFPKTMPEGVSESNQSGSPPGPGEQGQATSQNQAPKNPGVQDGNQMENTIDSPPGGPGEQQLSISGGKGKAASANLMVSNLQRLQKLAASYEEVEKEERKGMEDAKKGLEAAIAADDKEKTVEKKAWSVTNEGHEFDASGHRAMADMLGRRMDAREAYRADRPGLGGAATAGEVAAALHGIPAVGGTGALSHLMDRLGARHQEYAAKKHEGGRNAYNPFGGMLTETARERKKKASAEDTSLVEAFMSHVKQAEDAINPAKISAGPAVPPETSAAGEPGGAPAGGMPQGPTGLVGSNESAQNYTKQQAYANRKADLKPYLNEPALSSATDKTLQQAFAHTGEAGVKISSAQAAAQVGAARALLAKLAEATATEGNS